MGGAPKGRLSEGEWRVMRALWSAMAGSGGATAREVLEALGPGTDWAYTTVKTMLDRLAGKRVLARRRRGQAWLYRPRLSREEAQRREVEALKSGVFGGEAAPLVHFLFQEERLSERDRRELRRLLERAGIDPDAGEEVRG